MKKTILIISFQNQFGYHTDYYNYARYLSKKYKVVFLSIDEGIEKINHDNIDLIYIKNAKNKYKKIYKFIIGTKDAIDKYCPEYIIVKYYKGCSLLKSIVSKNNKCIMDIRTASITPNKVKREVEDIITSIEGIFFKYKTVITSEVARKLGFKNAMILPLGGKTFDGIDLQEKMKTDSLDLIYVGTLNGRKITDTIEAFNILSDKYDGKDLTYTIISNTKDNEEYMNFIEKIKSNKYGNIKFLGMVPNEMLGKYLKKCNIGVSYVPITDYYNFQPPTKTYEYLFNGLFTIATKTHENMIIINENNGLLIDDNVESFLEHLEYLYLNRTILNKNRIDIYNTIKNNSWENICKKLDNYISNL